MYPSTADGCRLSVSVPDGQRGVCPEGECQRLLANTLQNHLDQPQGHGLETGGTERQSGEN